LRLEIRNFKGIKEGSLTLGDLNILIGGNNSGKSTILEGLFLIPNPFRTVFNKTAIEILASLHSTLYSNSYIFLLHNYITDLASISYSDDSSFIKLQFQSSENRNYTEVYINENRNAYYLGDLSHFGIHYSLANQLQEAQLGQDGRFYRSSRVYSTFTPSFISTTIGNTIYFHPLLIKDIWSYFSEHWIELRNMGLFNNIIKKISEWTDASYDDLLLEPFTGNQQTIIARTKEGRGIRLGDLGSGFQVLITLMLLYGYVKPKILLIDDIESHMNPSLLIYTALWFADILNDGTKLVISTHSLEAVKHIAGSLEEYKPKITLMKLKDGILSTKDLSIKDVEDLEEAGIDVRIASGILL
jgi:AAA15 family ATPase/GTPase